MSSTKLILIAGLTGIAVIIVVVLVVSATNSPAEPAPVATTPTPVSDQADSSDSTRDNVVADGLPQTDSPDTTNIPDPPAAGPVEASDEISPDPNPQSPPTTGPAESTEPPQSASSTTDSPTSVDPTPPQSPSQTELSVRDGGLEFQVYRFECGLDTIEVEGPLAGQFKSLSPQNGQFCVLDFQATNISQEAQSIFSDYPNALDLGNVSEDGQPTIYPSLELDLSDSHPDGYCRYQIYPEESQDCTSHFDVPADSTISQIRFRDLRNSILKIGGGIVDLP